MKKSISDLIFLAGFVLVGLSGLAVLLLLALLAVTAPGIVATILISAFVGFYLMQRTSQP